MAFLRAFQLSFCFKRDLFGCIGLHPFGFGESSSSRAYKGFLGPWAHSRGSGAFPVKAAAPRNYAQTLNPQPYALVAFSVQGLGAEAVVTNQEPHSPPSTNSSASRKTLKAPATLGAFSSKRLSFKSLWDC